MAPPTTVPQPRHKYTDDDLETYFNRIQLPHRKRVHSVTHLSIPQKLSFLTTLQKHHLVKCPWENLTQHYSWHHTIHISPSHLFAKVVHNEGRGGYCMEINYFFHLILYALDFDVYMCGSRIYRANLGAFGGWTHVVNIVTIDGTKYLLDGGLGAAGPHIPMPLHDSLTQTHIAPAQMRLIYAPLPQNLNQEHKFWIFQHRYDEHGEWKPQYCFPDLEFTPQDLVGMNLEPGTNRHTFFTHKVVAVRFTTSLEINGPSGPGSPSEASLEGEIDGTLVLNHDVVKWRRRGEKVLEWWLKSEEERVQALEMYFGVVLDREEREGVLGTAAMIGARGMLSGND
ncbi:hypothetical protein PRZ48_006381 [Zasmidium cellare]|uniref:Arylamine N-acetyltransferase n=1 Tax=Zasmidium cellare TaxID=395010 RepID=A0ABR0EMX9_ZASCE|nr:hypothetical protein PRZ48_006381 [Zasmidium cellare]